MVFDEATGEWSLADVDFVPGTYVVRVNVRDNAGNVATSSENPAATFTVVAPPPPDETDPVGVATAPADGSTIVEGVYDVSGVASDDDSGVSRVLAQVRSVGESPNLFWNGSMFTESSAGSFLPVDFDESTGEWTLTDIDFEIGTYVVRVNVLDNAGNVATSSENPATTFVVEEFVVPDTADPFGVATAPADGSTIVEGVYDVSGTASDDDSGVSRVLAQVRSVGVSPNLFWNGSEFSESSAGSFLPVVFDESTGEWTLTDIDFEIGTYVVRVNVLDNAGNVATSSANPATTFIVEDAQAPGDTGPVVTVTSPVDGSVAEVGVYDIVGAAENFSGATDVYVLVRFNGDPTSGVLRMAGVDQATGSWNVPSFDFSQPGPYTLIVEAFDAAGNHFGPIESVVTFEPPQEDVTPPVVTVTSPVDGSVNEVGVYDIAGTASDPSGVAELSVLVRSDGDPMTDVLYPVTVDAPTGLWSIENVDFSVPGPYSLTVEAVDAAGNSTGPIESVVTFELPQVPGDPGPDVVDPVGIVVFPGDESANPAGLLDVLVHATDDDSGVDRVLVQVRMVGTSPTLFWDGAAFTEVSAGSFLTATLDPTGEWFLSGVDFSAPGTYEIRLNIRDNAGNVANAAENGVTQFVVEQGQAA